MRGSVIDGERERRLGRKGEGGWWILNSAGESFQRGKMRLPCVPVSEKGYERDGVGEKKSFRLTKWQSILLICLLSRKRRTEGKEQKGIEG